MITLESPRRVLLGSLRFKWMVCRAVLAWWPLLAIPVAFLLPPLVVAGLVCWAAAFEYVRRGWLLGTMRSAWWRSWWWADARAAGLVVVADPAVNATHERGGRAAVGLELAPPLRRIRCRGPRRVYVVRTLPGQTLATFERAVELLAHRWNAQVSVVEHGRRTVRVEVVNSALLAETVAHSRR